MNLYRTDNLLDLKRLQNTSIAFLGLGSLGSLVTSLLAYPWKKIVLIDPEKLEDSNVERHLLGYSQIGKYKVDGVKEWLVDRNVDPGRVVTITDMAKELGALVGVDILVVSIDDPDARYPINQFAVNNNIPAVYGGVYPMGTGGQTVIVPTPREICFYCAEKMLGVLDYQGKAPGGDYGVDPMALGKRNKLTAVPALKYSIAAVASDMALAVMDIFNKVAEPQILIHAQVWEDVLNVRPGKNLSQIAGYITSIPEMGLVSSMKLVPNDTGCVLWMKQGKLGIKLKRWNACTAHGSSFTPDQI